MDEELVKAIHEPGSGLLSARERAAVDFAGKLAGDHFAITEESYQELRSHFDDAELAELTMMTVAFLGLGRLLETLTRGITCQIAHP